MPVSVGMLGRRLYVTAADVVVLRRAGRQVPVAVTAWDSYGYGQGQTSAGATIGFGTSGLM